MKRLTKVERENGIGYKALLIAKDGAGNVARVTSPFTLARWDFDGNTWTLRAHMELVEDNSAGVYVTFDAKVVHKYWGKKCKVALSGKVIIHECGARGEFARLLEIEQ